MIDRKETTKKNGMEKFVEERKIQEENVKVFAYDGLEILYSFL